MRLQRAFPRVKAPPLWSPPLPRALIGEQWGVSVCSGDWGVGLTGQQASAPLSSALVYAPEAHSFGGCRGEEREALWGERSERAGGGEAPKRRWLGLW